MSKYKIKKNLKNSSQTRTDNGISLFRGIGLSAEELRCECDFREYLKKLRGFAKRYCVMVAAMDTPCGPVFLSEYSKAIIDIGITVDLRDKYRMAFVAVINAGELVYEELSKEPIEKLIDVDGHKIELLSVGFDMERSNSARLAVDGRLSQSIYRGLNFYVYDLVTGVVIDDVNFDTYAPSFPCKRVGKEGAEIRAFIGEHPGVLLCTFDVLPFPDDNLTENEQFIRRNAISRADVVNNLGTHSSALEDYYPVSDIPVLFSVPKSYHGIDGVRRFEDIRGTGVNIIGGHRITTDQQVALGNGRTIFLVGGCRVFGIGVRDDHTIASWLQRMVNDRFSEENIIVQNYGFFLAEMDSQSGEELNIIRSLPVKNGDIILYLCQPLEGVPYLNTANNSGRGSKEIFYDQMHYTPDGNRLMAEGLLNEMIEKGLLSGLGLGADSAGGVRFRQRYGKRTSRIQANPI